MKKFLVVLLVAIAIAQTGCTKCADTKGLPSCIKKLIEENKNKPTWYVGKIEEYRFQGKLVYAFEPDTRVVADASTTIMNDNCTTLCDVGGYGGPAVNLCNGENFFQDAVFIRVVWEKP